MNIEGRMLRTTIAEFEHRCEVHIEAELAKINPDNSLIDLLCDAVRLSREHMDWWSIRR